MLRGTQESIHRGPVLCQALSKLGSEIREVAGEHAQEPVSIVTYPEGENLILLAVNLGGAAFGKWFRLLRVIRVETPRLN